MIEEITFVIDGNGNVETEMRGVKGRACVGKMDQLHEILGFSIIERSPTCEMWEVPGGGGIRIGEE